MNKDKIMEYVENALHSYCEDLIEQRIDRYYGVNIIKGDIERYEEVLKYIKENLK